MRTIVRGGLAGVAGTLLMSLVIALGRAAGLVRTPPPEQITENVEWLAGIREQVPEPLFQASWMASHLGYGTACGVLYALLRPVLPAPPVPAGAGFGVAVWGVSYLGLMPSLGLYPGPKADSPHRVAVMLLAHVVFGVTVAEVERRLEERDSAKRDPEGDDRRLASESARGII